MASWEDSEVDSDSDELLDWLWDVPDRYDVGVDEALATEHSEALGVTKRLRRPGEADTIVTPPVAVARPVVDDRPTKAVDPVQLVEPPPAFAPALAPIMFAGERSRKRFSGRDIVAVAGVLLIIVVGLAIAYGLFGGRNSTKPSKPSNLAVGTQTTLPATTPTFDQGAVTVPTDTTTSTPGPTTTTAAPTTSSVAAAIGAATTSTTRHTTTTVKPTPTTYPIIVATVPQDTTTLPPPTTTTPSTVAGTTTTSSSVPASTTSSTSAFPKP